jgi:S1-C subfamily serine protease
MDPLGWQRWAVGNRSTGTMLTSRTTAAAALAILSWQPAAAQDSDASIQATAVAINQTTQFRAGTGVYLGNGFVLTASHVVGRALLREPRVTIAGQEMPAHIVKQDSFEQSDLALLAIDDQQLPLTLRQRRVLLCHAPPLPGQDVITVVPEAIVHSHVLSPVWLPLNARQYKTVISDVARTGNSGSGVFDAKNKCLLGIMSRKISEILIHGAADEKQTLDIAKYFVPVSVIEAFLPKEVLETRP